MQKKLVLPYNADYVELNKEEANTSLEEIRKQSLKNNPEDIVQNNDLIFSMYEKELKDKILNTESINAKKQKIEK